MFHNIFSKKTQTLQSSKPKPTIIIDNREKNSLVPSELVSLGFQLDWQQLPIGDYIINNTIVERKTLSDLQSSIINRRIFDQLNNLKLHQSVLLIIEFSSNTKIIHENALRGFLLSLATEFKIPFLFSKNEKETALFLSLLAKKQPNKEISLRHSPLLKTKAEQQQFILEGFPNIGPATAKKLLEEFKSLSNIFSASEIELEKIIGKKVKDFKMLLD